MALALGSWQRLKFFDWNALGAVFRSVHWGWMGVSALLVLGTYLARVLRWQIMIRPLAPEASAWRIFKATAKALDQATMVEERLAGKVLSTKGML